MNHWYTEVLRKNPGTFLKPTVVGAALGGLVGGGYAAATDQGQELDKRRLMKHIGGGALAGGALGGLVGHNRMSTVANRQAQIDSHGAHTFAYNQALDNESPDVSSFDHVLQPPFTEAAEQSPAMKFRRAIEKHWGEAPETKGHNHRVLQVGPRAFMGDINANSFDFDPSQLEHGTQPAYGPGSRRRSGMVTYNNVPAGLSKEQTEDWINQHVQNVLSHGTQHATEHMPVAPLDLSQGLRFDDKTINAYRDNLRKLLL